MDLIVLLVILGGVLFEVESGSDRQCTRISPAGNSNNIQCFRDLPFRCKKPLANPNCKTDDLQYKYDKNTKSCHKLHLAEKDWFDAMKTCVNEGSYLVIINSDNEANVLINLIPNNIHSVFLGIHDQFKEGSWLDIKGGPSEKTGYWNWNDGEPNNAGSGEDCGVMYKANGRLNDMFCSRKKPFVCERDV